MKQMTYGELTELLMAIDLPADAPVSVCLYDYTYGDGLRMQAAQAELALAFPHVLDSLAVVQATVRRFEPDNRLGLRLQLRDPLLRPVADHLWRDYIYREALRMHIIEPEEEPKTHKSNGNEREHTADRPFDPDRDAIG